MSRSSIPNFRLVDGEDHIWPSRTSDSSPPASGSSSSRPRRLLLFPRLVEPEALDGLLQNTWCLASFLPPLLSSHPPNNTRADVDESPFRPANRAGGCDTIAATTAWPRYRVSAATAAASPRERAITLKNDDGCVAPAATSPRAHRYRETRLRRLHTLHNESEKRKHEEPAAVRAYMSARRRGLCVRKSFFLCLALADARARLSPRTRVRESACSLSPRGRLVSRV